MNYFSAASPLIPSIIFRKLKEASKRQKQKQKRVALFLDNRRDFAQMGQTDFKPLLLSMLSVIIVLIIYFHRYAALFKIFILHNLIKQGI